MFLLLTSDSLVLPQLATEMLMLGICFLDGFSSLLAIPGVCVCAVEFDAPRKIGLAPIGLDRFGCCSAFA